MVGLDLGVAVEVGESVDHLAADVRSTGVLEVCPPLELRVGESGELATGVSDVEGSQGCLRWVAEIREFARSGCRRTKPAVTRRSRCFGWMWGRSYAWIQVRSSTTTGMTRSVLDSYSANWGWSLF